MIKKHLSHKILFIFVAVVAAVSLSGCSLLKTSNQKETTPEDTQMEVINNDTNSSETSMEMENSEVDMVIDMSMFKFSPNLIEAEAGQTLTIKLTNSEGFHDLVLDELDVSSKQISAGQETTITIEVPTDLESGTEYEFYCSVGNHRAQGMVGTFRVK